MATHSSILAWRIPWTRGAWRATVSRMEQSLTQLKRLSTAQYNENLLCSTELYSSLFGDLSGEEIQKRGDTCVCIADSLCSKAETDAAL